MPETDDDPIPESRDLAFDAAQVLESISDAFFTLDAEWRFTFLNGQAERLLARTRAELLGRNVWIEFPDAVGTASEREYRRAVDTQTAVSFEQFYPPLGTWFEARAYPSPGGISVYFRDITVRKLAEAERGKSQEALRQSEERYRLLVGDLEMGTWHMDLPSAVTAFSPRMAELYLLPRDAIDAPFEALMDSVHPDDRGLVQETVSRAVTRLESVRIEHRVVGRDGEVRWIEGRGRTYVGADNTPARFEGIAFDITERKAMEAEQDRLARREHTIAQQLQDALQPDVPRTVPGLALTKYYEAALAEAGVGGDFYDVFSVDKGSTALVVADLSGKGLEAAAQVATVRNMLRAYTYTMETLAEAVTELNRVIAENGLLSGFATVFVGVYDSGTGTLTYVNCGQEPALLRRWDTGKVEQLAPTGPVLGSFEGSVFETGTARFASGDTLAVFTDGLTEVGSSRRDMIGIEGVVAIMEGAISPDEDGSAEVVAEKLALRLIEGVDEAAQGGVVRDDMCLLIAVAH